MTGASDEIERDVLGGADGGESRDEAGPLISLQQDDPARDFDWGQR